MARASEKIKLLQDKVKKLTDIIEMAESKLDVIIMPLDQKRRLERSLSRSTAFPASQAAPTQENE